MGVWNVLFFDICFAYTFSAVTDYDKYNEAFAFTITSINWICTRDFRAIDMPFQ